jgi:glycosyltransferase involved in cell wall biosynthesis
LRICVIGKFPPIQGGVSMRTYWTAHALAARGHDVHVVTNAKEASPPFRMHMRPEDWQRCDGAYGDGRVTVHWTDPVDRSQSYLPMASPFVTKLATVAAGVHSEHPFDVIFSHYMEPYGVAGYLACQMTGVPHVVRMAGSDAGRLWHHPQFEALYDHVLRSAAVVVAGGVVAERAIERGVDPDRIAFGGGYVLPEHLFTPDGPLIDLDALRAEVKSDPGLRNQLWGDFAADRRYFGIYGKLGQNKGSFALLEALHRLKLAGLDVGLVALAHGNPDTEARFRERALELGLADRILQIPFLPHWRVPEFLRGCLAVCCLEQDFPIGFHSPIVPREVLLCGTCLVGSTEVIRKLPGHEGLPHGYGCVAVEDVNDVGALSGRLAAIASDPRPAAVVGARGRDFASELQQDMNFPEALELILDAAASRQRVPSSLRASIDDADEEAGTPRFPLTHLVAAAIGKGADIRAADAASAIPGQSIDMAAARRVLDAVERGIVEGRARLEPLASAVKVEIAIAEAEGETDGATAAKVSDPLFRLHMARWAMDEQDLARLVPVRDPQLRVLAFDYDVSGFLAAQSAAEFPVRLTQSPSYLVAFRRNGHEQREPLLVDRATAQILELCDGTRTAAQIAGQLNQDKAEIDDNLRWIEGLFRRRLIRLEEASGRPVIA